MPPNFIYINPIDNVLQDKAARVRTDSAKTWFLRNARNWLRNSENCAQLITLGEPDLPGWAIRRLQAGESIHRFCPSEAVNEVLTNCLRYIRSLEYTLDEQDVELGLIHEATRRLGQLRNITPDNIAEHYRTWEILRNGKIDRSANILAQIDDDEETHIDATIDRFWERITTLDRLKNTGEELNNCLANNFYDEEFICGDLAFWRLNDVNDVALAAMQIDILEYTAVEFKKYNNQLAREYAKDAAILLKEQAYNADGSDFLDIGITPTGHIIDTGKAPFSYQKNHTTTRIWGRGQLICLQRGDDDKLTLHLERESALEDILYFHGIHNFKARDYDWLGRSIAHYFNKADTGFELSDVIKIDNSWLYWRDAIIDQATFNKTKFYKTDKGIAIIEGDPFSPTWIISKHNSRSGQGGAPVYVYRLSEYGFDVISKIESHPVIAPRFWSWVNPKKNMGPSYSSLVKATDNPYCSNLQPQGWFSAEDRKSWLIFDSNIPNLPNAITLKYRWVFDEEGCNSIRVDGTHQKRGYAKQLAVFINDKPEISCLILKKRNRQGYWQRFFRMLVSDFKSPSAVAAIFSALWIEMESESERKFLQSYIEQNKSISTLVKLINIRPYHYSSRIDFDKQRDTVIINDRDDEGEYSELYSVDEDGNILWVADRSKGELNKPFFYQKDTGIENAIRYIQDQALRVTDDWQGDIKKQGYLRLDDGGINPVVSLYLNELDVDIEDHCLYATRDLDKNEYTWTISDECGDELWRLHPSSNSNHLKLESSNLNEEISSSVKSLVHAILDGCGKTMSPAQLGILNLMPRSTGGHEIADTDIFPLSRNEIEIDENLSWVQESTDWHLMENNTAICRFSYAPTGSEFFTLPSIPITKDIASAIIQFSELQQQAAELPFIFNIYSTDEFTENFPNILI